MSLWQMGRWGEIRDFFQDCLRSFPGKAPRWAEEGTELILSRPANQVVVGGIVALQRCPHPLNMSPYMAKGNLWVWFKDLEVGGILLDYLGGSNVITRVLTRRKVGASEELWAGKQSHSDAGLSWGTRAALRSWKRQGKGCTTKPSRKNCSPADPV